MNHDRVHCLDQDDSCPDECFRKKLNEDLENYRSVYNGYKMPVSWASMKGTECCPKKGEQE